jgi:hypothetical protein
MADLLKALQQSYYTPQETEYGIAADIIGKSTPAFYNPYASTGQNLATGIGGALVSGLLGGMARGSAAKRNAEMLPQIQQIFQAPASQRMQIVGENQRLSPLVAAMQAQEFKQQQDLAKMQQQKLIDLQYAPLMEGTKALVGAQAEQGQYYVQGLDGKPILATAGQANLLDPYQQQQKMIAEKDKATFGTSTERSKRAGVFRKEFQSLPQVKRFMYLDENMKALEKAVLDPDAMSAVEIVRRGIQFIEPGLAVRTDDQLDVAARQALPERLYAEFKQAKEGGVGLSAEARMGILNIARRAYIPSINKFNQELRRYNKLKTETEGFAPDKNILGYDPIEVPNYNAQYTLDKIKMAIEPGYLPKPLQGETKEAYKARVKEMGAK